MVLFYEIVIVIISIAVLMAFMTHGFKKGAASEITGMFSLIFAALILYLLSQIVSDFMTSHLGGFASSLIMLAVVIGVYRVLHIFFTAINFIAHAPLLEWLDKGAGFVVGLVEGFFVLYILQYLLEHYLLA